MEERYTVAELAALWKVSERTIQRHIDTGRLSVVNLGTAQKRNLRITAEAILAFEEKNNAAAKALKKKNKMRGVKQFYRL